MSPIYPPYDFLLISSLTFAVGFLISKLLAKRFTQYNLYSKLLPYAIAYLGITIGIAFIQDELPLKFYGPDPAYDYEQQRQSKGPDIGKGLLAGFAYLSSVAFNFAMWGICVLIYFRAFRKFKSSMNSELLDNDIN